MKINSTRGEIQGAALMTTLVICAVLAIMMAGYLMFARQQNFLTHRSQTWNTAMPVAEAGIEEGMQHLNDNFTNLASQGWTQSGTSYFRSNTLPNGDSYNVAVYLSNAASPQIVSRAQVYTPSYAMGSSPMFATLGVTANVNSPIARAVGVTCARSSLFINALTAKHTIDLNGNDVMTDSFDSAIPAYNTAGQYDVTKRRDNGGVASNDTIENAVNVGNANIYGKIATGPQGTADIGPNGRVGPTTWTNAGIYPGWFSDDMNFTFPKPQMPGGSVFTPAGGFVTNFLINVSSATTPSYPAPPPATGVTTNVIPISSTNYPVVTPSGGTSTNIVTAYVASPTYPAAGSYQGSVTTNTVSTTSATKPAAGTYLGTVTTNTLFTSSTNAPAVGTYQGSVTTRTVNNGGNGNNGNGTGQVLWYDYYRITSYVYNLITGYGYWAIISTTYSYVTYTYTYAIPVTNIVDVQYYDYILDAGNYQLSDLPNGKVLVRGAAHLDVTGGVDLSNAEVHYASGGSLNLYVHSDFSLSGNKIFNTPGYAKNFIVWADEGCTSISFSGNAAFTGVLYAPYVNLALNGGGTDAIDFIGAAVINSARLNGHFNFHYDEDLGNLGGGRFIITAWHEL